MTAASATIQRSRFALAVGVAAPCAIAAAALLADRAEGAEAGVTGAVAGAVLFLALLSVFGMLGRSVIRDEIWGMAVLGITAARTLLAMIAMLVLIEVAGLPRQPVVHGLLAGTLILTTAEACAAVWLLQRRERSADAARHAPAPPRTGGPAAARRSP